MLLGPPGKSKSYNEIGRAIATLMVDDVSMNIYFLKRFNLNLQNTELKESSIVTHVIPQLFSDVAYKARDREDLIAGIDEFLDEVTVLPPGEWDPKIRIEPPKKLPSVDKR